MNASPRSAKRSSNAASSSGRERLSGWWTVEGVDGANERSEGAPIQLGASSIPIAEAEDSALPHDEPASR
jgi:hypothetical protein